MIEQTFLEELILIKQVQQKNVIFVAIGIFWIKDLSFKSASAIDVIMSISNNGIAVLSINSANYGCIIKGISKKDGLNLPKICRFYESKKL